MAERTVNGVHEQDEDAHPYLEEMEKRKGVPNRLVLCFDGTGNSFAGNTSDTNIVKLVNKLKRDAPHQMLYYQRKSFLLSSNHGRENADIPRGKSRYWHLYC